MQEVCHYLWNILDKCLPLFLLISYTLSILLYFSDWTCYENWRYCWSSPLGAHSGCCSLYGGWWITASKYCAAHKQILDSAWENSKWFSKDKYERFVSFSNVFFMCCRSYHRRYNDLVHTGRTCLYFVNV